ncbi:hypothetical protein RhiirC2_705371 [Rhizophagus irregularis]|uniref:BZIP domain-containing protein n=1 Tax=Rhizophagus irregularis TaxID=588596 RepID=A0A2N1NYM0_9GLOM|nr:hypothetical protein RhiirC2_705371 [Rhizophagus irregularis]
MKIRENKNPNQRTKRRAREHESKSKNRAAESPEKRQERLERERNQKRQRRALNKERILKDANERLNHQGNECNLLQNRIINAIVKNKNSISLEIELLYELDHEFLRKFRNK